MGELIDFMPREIDINPILLTETSIMLKLIINSCNQAKEESLAYETTAKVLALDFTRQKSCDN